MKIAVTAVTVIPAAVVSAVSAAGTAAAVTTVTTVVTTAVTTATAMLWPSEVPGDGSIAHGDLRKLVQNGQLNGLVGGVETVIVGDAVAAKHGGRKTLAEHASAPTFEVVVMMRRGARHEAEVVRDAAVAVDAIIAGEKYKLELRQRDPATGALWVRLDKA